jgi:uncharacterized protein (TIGR02611 family)
VKRRWARWRDRLRERPTAEFGYRIAVAVIGLAVLGVGVLAIPYPGPGWAIVFVGLGLLATEFDWARSVLAYARERYDRAMAWFKAQHIAVRTVGAAFTGAVVVATLWLLGAVGWSADLVGLEHTWLKSPIGLGA